MINAMDREFDPNFLSYRERLDHLRKDYQRTYELLEQEGKRLDRFLEKAPLAAGTDRAENAAESELLIELTPRERETLRSIAEGLSTKETAERLGIRFKTAACHRYRLMQKLGVHETTSLVRIAIRAGIVTP